MRKLNIKEEWLHAIWKYGWWERLGAETASGEFLEVVKTGMHNTQDGPDFLDAHVRVGNISWYGHVEIHARASDFLRHKHQFDRRYQTVILHVVWENDALIEELLCPVLELKSRVPKHYISRASQLLYSQEQIPCAGYAARVDPMIVGIFKEKMILERLQDKWHRIKTIFDGEFHPKHVFYLLLYGLGLPHNAESMVRVAESLPWKLLIQKPLDTFEVESLLFGYAGLLKDPQDDEARRLSWSYEKLKKRWDLEEEQEVIFWNRKGIRPPYFPERMLAFAAVLFVEQKPCFAGFGVPDMEELARMIHGVVQREYWQSHYSLGIGASKRLKINKHRLFRHLWANVYLPVVVHGHIVSQQGEEQWETLSNFPAEQNSILRKMIAAGFSNMDGKDSQSLIHLYKNYCAEKKCLDCRIGIQIMANSL